MSENDKDKPDVDESAGSTSSEPQPAATTAKSESSTDLKTGHDQQKDSGQDWSQSTSNDDEKTGSAQKKRKKAFSIAALIFIALILAAGGSSYWLYQDNLVYKQLLTHQRVQQDEMSQQLNQLKRQLDQLGEKQQTLVTRADQVENKNNVLSVSIEQVNDQLQALASEKGKDPLYWRIAEVEYLLSVANHRLTLERDVDTTKMVLQDADKRLKAIGDPAFIPVREKIARELNQLNALDLPDVPGIASQLASLEDTVVQWPFVRRQLADETAAGQQSLPGENQQQEESLLKTIWNDVVNGLFRPQRTDQPIEPMLPPDEKKFLVHNINLKLEQSRLALFERNTSVFHNNLQDIAHYLKNYFDNQNNAVSGALDTVQQLSAVELKPGLPDISGSLREIRGWIKRQQFAAYQPVQQTAKLRHSTTGAVHP